MQRGKGGAGNKGTASQTYHTLGLLSASERRTLHSSALRQHEPSGGTRRARKCITVALSSMRAHAITDMGQANDTKLLERWRCGCDICCCHWVRCLPRTCAHAMTEEGWQLTNAVGGRGRGKMRPWEAPCANAGLWEIACVRNNYCEPSNHENGQATNQTLN